MQNLAAYEIAYQKATEESLLRNPYVNSMIKKEVWILFKWETDYKVNPDNEEQYTARLQKVAEKDSALFEVLMSGYETVKAKQRIK